jgi:hypothetical protein
VFVRVPDARKIVRCAEECSGCAYVSKSSPGNSWCKWINRSMMFEGRGKRFMCWNYSEVAILSGNVPGGLPRRRRPKKYVLREKPSDNKQGKSQTLKLIHDYFARSGRSATRAGDESQKLNKGVVSVIQ